MRNRAKSWEVVRFRRISYRQTLILDDFGSYNVTVLNPGNFCHPPRAGFTCMIHYRPA